MQQIDIHTLEAKLRDVLNDSAKTPSLVLATVMEHYSSYQIIISDVLADNNDALLFQYGIYNWYDGKGERFELDFTRQVKDPDSDEFYQLGLTLYYEPNDIGNIVPLNIWSNDCTSIIEWAAAIKNTEGFKRASKLNPIEFLVAINQT